MSALRFLVFMGPSIELKCDVYLESMVHAHTHTYIHRYPRVHTAHTRAAFVLLTGSEWHDSMFVRPFKSAVAKVNMRKVVKGSFKVCTSSLMITGTFI